VSIDDTRWPSRKEGDRAMPAWIACSSTKGKRYLKGGGKILGGGGETNFSPDNLRDLEKEGDASLEGGFLYNF